MSEARAKLESGGTRFSKFSVVGLSNATIDIGISNGLFWALVHPVIVYTDVPTYLVGNVAKIISVTVASTISFFLMRYVVFSRRRWFTSRL